MRRKSFEGMACPIARSLEQVGEWWSMLILRDAFAGHLAVRRLPAEPRHRAGHADPAAECAGRERAPGTPALQRAAAAGRVPADRRAARDFAPVLIAMLAWGNRHFAPEGETLADRRQPDRRARRPDAGRPGQRPAADGTRFHRRRRAGRHRDHAPPAGARQSAARRGRGGSPMTRRPHGIRGVPVGSGADDCDRP